MSGVPTTTPQGGTRLLTTREVAELLAVAPERVLRRVRAGELPAIRIASNALRFREEAIEAHLERLESVANPCPHASRTRFSRQAASLSPRWIRGIPEDRRPLAGDTR